MTSSGAHQRFEDLAKQYRAAAKEPLSIVIQKQLYALDREAGELLLRVLRAGQLSVKPGFVEWVDEELARKTKVRDIPHHRRSHDFDVMAGFLDPYCSCLHHYCQTYLTSIVTQHVKELTALDTRGMDEAQVRVVWVERAHALAASCEAIANRLISGNSTENHSTPLPPIEKWEPVVSWDPIGKHTTYSTRMANVRVYFEQFGKWATAAAADTSVDDRILLDSTTEFSKCIAPYLHEVRERLRRLIREAKTPGMAGALTSVLGRLQSDERQLISIDRDLPSRLAALKATFEEATALLTVNHGPVPAGWLFIDKSGRTHFKFQRTVKPRRSRTTRRRHGKQNTPLDDRRPIPTSTPANKGDGPYLPANVFSKSLRGRLRHATQADRQKLKVRSRLDGGVKMYCLVDIAKWWWHDLTDDLRQRATPYLDE